MKSNQFKRYSVDVKGREVGTTTIVTDTFTVSAANKEMAGVAATCQFVWEYEYLDMEDIGVDLIRERVE